VEQLIDDFLEQGVNPKEAKRTQKPHGLRGGDEERELDPQEAPWFRRPIGTLKAPVYTDIGHRDEGTGDLMWYMKKGRIHAYPVSYSTHGEEAEVSLAYGRVDKKTRRVSVAPGDTIPDLSPSRLKYVANRLAEKWPGFEIWYFPRKGKPERVECMNKLLQRVLDQLLEIRVSSSGDEAVVSKYPQCDFCTQEAHYDGKTTQGPWAYMCDNCFKEHGVGLGTGRGQRLVLAKERQESCPGRTREEQIEPNEIDWGLPTTPEEAYHYARYVLKGRFAEGEPAIAQDARWSYRYARYVLKGRFAEGESAIAQDAVYSKAYSQDILGRHVESLVNGLLKEN
jgi:hypothetical protein